MSVLTLSLSLLACWEENIVIPGEDPDADPPAAALVPGAYEIQILGVDALACEGLSPRDVVGQSLHAMLAVSGEDVQLDFEGWQLAGSMAGGELFADGTSGWTEGRDDDEDVGYDEEPPADELYAAISASVVSDRLAHGALSMEMPGCSMELDAALIFVGPGGGEEPPVVTEPPPEEEEPCGRESDCG